MTKDKIDAEALRVEALAHARNCVVAQNSAAPNTLDMPALRELDALIDQGQATRMRITMSYRIRLHVKRALERIEGIDPRHMGDPALVAFAELGRLAIEWADALEAAYGGPLGDDGRETHGREHDARAALLRVLLPPGSEALRWL